MCHDVAVEPPLQPLTGEAIVPTSANRRDDARADIHARGFWGRQQGAFFDIRVFHPNAASYRRTQVGSLFRRHELEKKREYGDRIRSVVSLFYTFGIFLPSVVLVGRPPFSTVALPTCLLYDITFSTVKCCPGCAVPSFSLLRSAILAIRGNRTLTFAECPSISTELCLVESHIDFTIKFVYNWLLSQMMT